MIGHSGGKSNLGGKLTRRRKVDEEKESRRGGGKLTRRRVDGTTGHSSSESNPGEESMGGRVNKVEEGR
jgi:hypothetical protein